VKFADASPIWLRDNCPCPTCRHPATRERTVQLIDCDVHEPPHVPLSAYEAHTVGEQGAALLPVELGATMARITYDELRSASGLRRWLTHLVVDGLIVVEEVPTKPDQVLKLAEFAGYARPTNFGIIFDVESKPDPNNSAYTALGLELHSDLPNYATPPDYQLLHALANDATGGDSLIADAFAVAEQLRSQNPEAFEVLATWPVAFRFHDSVDDIRFSAPTIGLDGDRVVIVRFNNWIRDFDPSLAGADGVRFYNAYLAFWRLLREPANSLRLRLATGEALCFDNRRMLHGRTAFDPNTGHRHLQGCYIDHDMVLSRLRRLAVAHL
jgi:gamma-butyrobetaine dioxygenase